MEAATATPTRRDQDLALKLGSLLKHVLNPAGDSAFRVIDESGLTFVQTKALLALATTESEHLSVKLVREQLNVSLPSASRAVDGLFKAKLVTRAEDPDDRRVRRIALTAKGRRLSDEIITARLAGLERFAASLSPDQRDKLNDALDALLERDEIGDAYRSQRQRGRRR